MSIALHLLHMI